MNKINFNPYLQEGIIEKCRLVIFNNNTKKFVITEIIDYRQDFDLDLDGFDKNMNYTYQYQIKDNKHGVERWINKTLTKRLYNEQITNDGIKYIFFEEADSNKLVIMFQAINKDPTYNYIGSLADKKVNRLYIKDDYGGDEATKSSYYIGQNKDLSIAISTQKLIKVIVKKYNIKSGNTIFCGSSKGGFAALYHGYKFGAGHIIPGGPQILLGDYLYINSPNSVRYGIFRSIVGDFTKENKEWANSLLYNALKSSKSPYPKTKIHIGNKEPHYEEHVVPFMEWVKELAIPNVELDLQDYSTHEELAKYYPIFLEKEIDRFVGEKE